MKDLIRQSKWTSSSKTKPLDYSHYRSIGDNEDWVCSFWSPHGNAEFSLRRKTPKLCESLMRWEERYSDDKEPDKIIFLSCSFLLLSTRFQHYSPSPFKNIRYILKGRYYVYPFKDVLHEFNIFVILLRQKWIEPIYLIFIVSTAVVINEIHILINVIFLWLKLVPLIEVLTQTITSQ